MILCMGDVYDIVYGVVYDILYGAVYDIVYIMHVFAESLTYDVQAYKHMNCYFIWIVRDGS